MPSENLRSRLDSIGEEIERAAARSGRTAGDIRLVVVTKTHPVETVQDVVDLGVTDIGENLKRNCIIKRQLSASYIEVLCGLFSSRPSFSL